MTERQVLCSKEHNVCRDKDAEEQCKRQERALAECGAIDALTSMPHKVFCAHRAIRSARAVDTDTFAKKPN